jgi:ATP-binding cassette subfamily B protein
MSERRTPQGPAASLAVATVPWMAVLLAASAAAAVAELVVPAVLGRAMDAVLDDAGGRGHAAGGWLIVGAGLLVTIVAGNAVTDLAGGVGSARATGRLRRRTLRHIFDAGPSLADRHPPGDLCSRVIGNTVESARSPVAAADLIVGTLPTVGSLVALALLHPWLLVTFTVGTGVLAAVLHTFFHTNQGVAGRYLGAQSAISIRLVDALGGARTIAAAGTVDREVERVLAPLSTLQAEGRDAWRTLARGSWQGATLAPLIQIAVIGVAGLLLENGQLGPGQLLAAGWYAALGTGIGDAVSRLSQLARARAATRRLAEVLAAPVPSYGPQKLPPGPGDLVLRGITVSAGDESLLEDLDLAVPGGMVVAVVGLSPAALSAIATIAGRLRDPDAGAVLLDGVPIGQLTRPALRDAVAYAFDRPVLLGDTIAEAIAFGRAEPTPRGVPEAARAACADLFVERLPEGYGTPLDDAPLSGGEAQRLGLARAFAHPGRLLILDDATSSLDTVTEHQISEALASAPVGRTRLVIAHRASTAGRADLVAWIEGGRVRSLAPHETLWLDADYRAVFMADPLPTPAAP